MPHGPKTNIRSFAPRNDSAHAAHSESSLGTFCKVNKGHSCCLIMRTIKLDFKGNGRMSRKVKERTLGPVRLAITLISLCIRTV